MRCSLTSTKSKQRTQIITIIIVDGQLQLLCKCVTFFIIYIAKSVQFYQVYTSHTSTVFHIVSSPDHSKQEEVP